VAGTDTAQILAGSGRIAGRVAKMRGCLAAAVRVGPVLPGQSAAATMHRGTAAAPEVSPGGTR